MRDTIVSTTKTDHYYDECNRIQKIDANGVISTYHYDPYGQLIREDNQALDKTYVYAYNEIGNVVSVSAYSYTAADSAPSGIPVTTSFGYTNDRLTSFGGATIAYNAIGCPTTHEGKNLTWSNGKLSRMFSGTVATGTSSYNYTYNAFGQRVSKTYSYLAGTSSAVQIGQLTGANKTYYYDHAGRLISETVSKTYNSAASSSESIVFLYDESSIIGMVRTDNGVASTYYFQRNLLGDVVAIYDTSGNMVAKYLYDAWGNCTVSSETTNYAVANANPIRYRGYYYDDDTGLYYCNARYYSPKWRRFISPDDTAYLDPENVNGLNLYCYCNNDPVNYCDPSGYMPEWLGTTLKILAGVAIIVGCVVGSMLTGGMMSVVLAGAAIGAAAGGIGAGISTAISGGDIHDFGNAFLMGTATGAASGAVAASPLGTWWQAGINAAISMTSYAGTQALSGNNITLGGLVTSGVFGFACGFIGQNGWMQEWKTCSFITFGGRNALKHVVSMVGTETLLRMTLPAFAIGGIEGGIYGRISEFFNPEGSFFGI